MWAKHAHSVVASQSCPHSCTVSRQLPAKLHGLLPLASRQKPTPRATDRAVAGAGEGGEGGEGGGGGGEGGGGGGGGGEDGEVKQTLKPPPTTEPSDDQLSAEASTPSGPSVPE